MFDVGYMSYKVRPACNAGSESLHHQGYKYINRSCDGADALAGGADMKMKSQLSQIHKCMYTRWCPARYSSTGCVAS